MNFDLSKENIQPLRGGRNVSQLDVALQAQTDAERQRELLRQKEEWETVIKTYVGADPLENWYNYFSWLEQSYPSHGHEGNLLAMLEHCLSLFEHDVRYKEDRRLCKLFIKYLDNLQNPSQLYHMMWTQGLCRSCADLYKAWAYYYEAAGDFRSAHDVFECGKREHAQPYEELQAAHDNLITAAGRHIIYGSNERDLSEKRQALTSLRTYKAGQVGSIRMPSNSHIGSFGHPVGSRPNASVPIYEDCNEGASGITVGPNSIIGAAKLQHAPKENTFKPGPWTTMPVKTKQSMHRNSPGFKVHEDTDQCDDIKPSRVSTTSENYSNWVVSLTIPEPQDDTKIPVYPKDKVYSQINTEYSLEEIRAMRYKLAKNQQFGDTPFNVSNKSVLENLSYHEQKDTLFSTFSPRDQQAVKDMNRSSLGIMPIQCSPNKSGFENRFSNLNCDLWGNSVTTEIAHASGDFTSKGTPNSKLIFQENLEVRDTSIKQLSARNVRTKNCTNNSNKSPKEKSFLKNSDFDLWEDSSSTSETAHTSVDFIPNRAPPKSNIVTQESIESRGSAMRTLFNNLNTEDLAETGSRGGMDIAAAAPVDSARRIPIYDEDSSSSYDVVLAPIASEDLACNTQMFNFNLNVINVSTPQKQDNFKIGSDTVKISPKQLFTKRATVKDNEKSLSTIVEERKSSGFTSSNEMTTNSFSSNSHVKQNTLQPISEEHNNYLAQNLMANAALRSSSLGNLIGFDDHPIQEQTSAEHNRSVSKPRIITPLNFVPSDPFQQSLIEKLLDRVNFPGTHTQGYVRINNIPRLSVRKEFISLGSDKYVIEKQLGKGTFGTVFRGYDNRTGLTKAVKFQRPANMWEFYICRELQARLIHHPLRDRFMDVTIGYFTDQCSVLISEFVPCGSLLDVANMVKQRSGRSMKESLCIYFCVEMLRVVQAMHEVQIIHADIKPDNFLVKLYPGDVVGLQLIDFGCSIDMSLFPAGASFTRKVTTEDFVCCEMKDNRPWNYHTDLYCIAATAHVLLFEKYIQLQKKDGHWSIVNRLPRYARVDLWNMFFNTLLNQQNGPADSLSLQAMLEDSLKHKFDDYHNELRYLTNMLKNR